MTGYDKKLATTKNIIQKLSYEDFRQVCEELNVVEDALKKLWILAIDTDDPRVKTDIYKWIIEMNIGKPRQSTEIKGELNIPSLIVGNIDKE